MTDETEAPEERHFIQAPEAELHDLSGDCRCKPVPLDVSLQGGKRKGVAWKHNHLDGPCPPAEVVQP